MLAFTYKEKGEIGKYQYFFRIGDIVRVRRWGAAYSSWRDGNRYFTGTSINPFYNEYWNERENGILFKVKKMAFHSNNRDGVICYIEDRERKGIIINANALQVIKQFPLRKDEKQLIEIEKIK
jgi:hypothetical protein